MGPGTLASTARLLACACCLTAAIIATAPTAAWADGDPASDELIQQNVFSPLSSPVSATAQAQLDREVAVVHRAGVA